jgi:hypothetical protein
MTDLIPVTERSITISNIITLWLKAKREASDSVRTEEVYARLMNGFRSRLIDAGYDLDGLLRTFSHPLHRMILAF